MNSIYIHTKQEDPECNYKDTVFRMLFGEKKNLLSLYNALNSTAYTDITDLEITTLENAVYMNYKNDISFVEPRQKKWIFRKPSNGR